MTDTFVLTSEHVRLLTRAVVGWQDDEYGAPEIDPKRPYGNSSVACDIAEILGWPLDEDDLPTAEQRERAYILHRETEAALQIILVTHSFAPGTYRLRELYARRSWYRVEGA